MFRSRSANLVFSVITLLVAFSGSGAVEGASPAGAASFQPEIRVTLSAASHTVSWDERDRDGRRFELPLLYLRRERDGTAALERTLVIRIAGLAGARVLRLEAVSQHVNVSTGRSHVLSTRVIIPDRPCTIENPCTLTWTLDEATPSDFYYLRVMGRQGQTLWVNTPVDRPAFVALDTWDVNVGSGLEPAGVVRVIYATLFPFARGKNDLQNRLSPDQVTDFIEEKFVPIIKHTWHTQAEEWAFGDPLHPDWDADGIIEVVITDPPFALFGGTGTYSLLVKDGDLYPERRIWWFSRGNSFQAHDTLEDGYKSLFAHEFFHLMQWNVLLSSGRPTNLWISWIEAQARFVATVQYPDLELHHADRGAGIGPQRGAYASTANRFLTRHLNSSLEDLEQDEFKYDDALYWRFLYERYDGMDIVRTALSEMANHVGPDTETAMERALEAAFARLEGPFYTFEESLVAFARANYALKLTNGRCKSPDLSTCDGLYFDPGDLYQGPSAVARLSFDGATTTYQGAIPSRTGMDFVEIKLERTVHNRPLTIRLRQGKRLNRFYVQVWTISPGLSGPRVADLKPKVVWQDPNGEYIYVMPKLDTLAYNRLILIISRFNTYLTEDPYGSYRVVLDATG